MEQATEELKVSLEKRSQIFAQIPTIDSIQDIYLNPPPQTASTMLEYPPPRSPATATTAAPPPPSPTPIATRAAAAAAAAKTDKRSAKKVAAAAAAAKARIASRLSANAQADVKKKKSFRGHRHSSNNRTGGPKTFHYLGGSLNLRAERERRKELEERLVATQSAVQRSTEEMQPSVAVLLQSVGVLEEAAAERHKLDIETGTVLEGMQSSVSLVKRECATKLDTMETYFKDRLNQMEQHFREERARDKIAFTKLARSHQAELALLRSKYSAFQESTKKRLDSLPSAISKLRSESRALVEPLSQRLSVVSQAVGQLDQAVFDVDREQLRIKLAMRNDDPATGSPVRGGFMDDSLDQSVHHPKNTEVRESVVRRLQKDLRELVQQVANDRSTMRQRTDEQATKLSNLGSTIDSHNTTQQRANSELHELVARITSVMRGDLSDQLKMMQTALALDTDEKIANSVAHEKKNKQDDSNSNATKYAEIVNHAQATASRAAVDADEALRYAREAMAKIGSVDAGLASRIVNSRQTASRRALDIENELEKLIRRVDVLSSELATNTMR